MTKLLPTGCIKQNLDITWRSFNLLLQNVNLHDKIGYFYVADIEFDHTKATENIVYNEIYPPIIKKQKIIIHVKGQYINCLNNILQQKKEIHDHIKKLKKPMRRCLKKIQPMFLEKLSFAINRAGWRVTKIFSHYTFEQECFKKNFILVN